MQAFPVLLNVDADAEAIKFGLESRFRTRWISGRIDEYLQRSLSYESDMLNAFMGVLRQAWFSPDATYHFWGLPFMSKLAGNGPLDADVLSALFWSKRCAAQPTVTSRREKFPSWTWAAWRNLSGFIPSELQRLDGAVEFEDVANTRIGLGDYMLRMQKSWNILDFKPVMHITGWFVIVGIKETFRRSLATCTINIPAINETTTEFAFAEVDTVTKTKHLENFTHEEPVPMSGTWPAIMFTGAEDTRTADGTIPNAHGLLLREHGNEAYERVGTFSFCVDDLPQPDYSQIRRRAPHDTCTFAVRSWNRRRPGERTGSLSAVWKTIKLV
jgi:hypothetical protein